MKKNYLGCLPVFALVCTGCSTTIGGALFIFTLGDMFLYTFMALVMGAINAVLSAREKRMKAFWFWFILSILLTPLAGLINIIIRISGRNRKRES